MCKTEMAVLASVLAGLLLLAALPASASAGLAGFQYQREITICENSGETLRDYQVLVELAGSDFPEVAQADGDDIRFTDADGVNLGYWIEEFDAGSERARIWVKVPLVPANGEAMITMWYGNPGTASESDGEAVFELFDDFNDNKLNTDKWTIYTDSTGSVTENDGYLQLNLAKSGGHQGAGIYSVTYPKKSYVIDTEIMVENSAYDGCGGGNCGPGGIYLRHEMNYRDNQYYGHQIQYYIRLGTHSMYKSPSSSTISLYDDASAAMNDKLIKGSWYSIALKITPDNMEYYVNTKNAGSISIKPATWANLGSKIRFEVYHSDYQPGGHYGVDNFRVRKYTPLEPTTTLEAPRSSDLSITKSPAPHSIRQFQETTITLSIENSGTVDATDIEITDRVHPSFDLTSGDFPNPKRYDLIRPGETRDLQYTIKALESGTFTLDPATITYADEDRNIQEAKSEPASIKVILSTEGSASGTSRSNPSVTTASVQLHGEKTDVVLGEDILLKLSAVNLITKPTMHVQVIIIPPSGMSVTSSAFAKSGAGQYTTTYELEPGSGKDIEVAIRSNQVGDFDVNGRIIYYFGDDREDAEDHTLTLPITVRAELEAGAERTTGTSESGGSSTPGFAAVVAITGLLLAYMRKRS